MTGFSKELNSTAEIDKSPIIRTYSVGNLLACKNKTSRQTKKGKKTQN